MGKKGKETDLASRSFNKKGTDSDENLSSVARFEAIRMLLAFRCCKKF